MADEEVTSDPYTTEKLNFFRLSSILIDDGTQSVFEILVNLVTDLPKWLKNMKKVVEKCVYKPAFRTLYPDDPPEKYPSSANFDLTVLFTLLLDKRVNYELVNVLKPTDWKNLQGILEKLRTKRNSLYAHVRSCSIETALYDKEYQELHVILVDELPKFGCHAPNLERWTERPILLDEVTRLAQKVRELIENDRDNMMIVGELLTKEIEKARAENVTMSSAIDVKLVVLCEEFAVLAEASRRGEDDMNRLGSSVGRLVDVMGGIAEFKNSVSELLLKLDDENLIRGPLNDIQVQLKQHFDLNLAAQRENTAVVVGDLTRVIEENTNKVIDSVKQIEGKHSCVLPTMMQTTKGCRDEDDSTKAVKVMKSFKEAFNGKREWLVSNLNIKHGLLTALRNRLVLTKEQIDEIDHVMKTNLQSVEALLNALEQRPDSDFEIFCECLEEKNQKHIADELRRVV
jgi:hypothetical protein